MNRDWVILQKRGGERMKRIAFIALLVLAITATTAHASIIYDNTTTPVIWSTGGEQVVLFIQDDEGGDEINLSGTSRVVTQIDLYLYADTTAVTTADTQVRFYANDGPFDSVSNEPGTLLWDSGVLNDLSYSPGLNVTSFSVPDILVPDTFTWTVQYSDSTETNNLGIAVYDPPTVGSSGDWVWLFFPDPDDPDSYWYGGDPAANLGARVYAKSVPEPSTLLLFGAGLVGVGVLRRRFKS